MWLVLHSAEGLTSPFMKVVLEAPMPQKPRRFPSVPPPLRPPFILALGSGLLGLLPTDCPCVCSHSPSSCSFASYTQARLLLFFKGKLKNPFLAQLPFLSFRNALPPLLNSPLGNFCSLCPCQCHLLKSCFWALHPPHPHLHILSADIQAPDPGVFS